MWRSDCDPGDVEVRHVVPARSGRTDGLSRITESTTGWLVTRAVLARDPGCGRGGGCGGGRGDRDQQARELAGGDADGAAVGAADHHTVERRVLGGNERP